MFMVRKKGVFEESVRKYSRRFSATSQIFLMVQMLTYIQPGFKFLNYIRLNHTNIRPLFETISFLMITACFSKSAMKCSAV